LLIAKLMSANPQAAGVLSFEQACETIDRYYQGLKPPATESVKILDALGRILAEPILADRDFPPFPRATRDGFALHSSNIQNVPVTLRVVGQLKAGGSYNKAVRPGEAVEIMTGAPVPEGANAVVMVEYTTSSGTQVEIQRTCASGENIVPRGSEAKAGAQMLSPGIRMSFAQIAVAASVGKATLQVYRKPRVAILSTGDEIVELAATPNPQQIRNSNSYSLAAQVMLAGGEPVQLPIAPDEPEALKRLIHEGLSADLLLLSGGVSMGKFDFVEQVLAELKAKFFFTGAKIQPGKPVVFGEASVTGSKAVTPFFGLPGNPISTMVTFDLFAKPVLQTLSGALPVRLPAAKARLAKQFKTKTGLTRFLPAVVRGAIHDPEVEIVSWQGSGDLQASAQANCYAVIPPDRESIAAGEMVSILLRS
jgi:molybdopterin molybdotransferase